MQAPNWYVTNFFLIFAGEKPVQAAFGDQADLDKNFIGGQDAFLVDPFVFAIPRRLDAKCRGELGSGFKTSLRPRLDQA